MDKAWAEIRDLQKDLDILTTRRAAVDTSKKSNIKSSHIEGC